MFFESHKCLGFWCCCQQLPRKLGGICCCQAPLDTELLGGRRYREAPPHCVALRGPLPEGSKLRGLSPKQGRHLPAEGSWRDHWRAGRAWLCPHHKGCPANRCRSRHDSCSSGLLLAVQQLKNLCSSLELWLWWPRIAALSCGGAHGHKPTAWGPQRNPHPAPCSCGLQREGISPPSLSSCSSSERLEIHQECQSSPLQEPLDFISVMKSATSKELIFDQDHKSCTRKPRARPSLPPYLLYKVSKFHYDVSFTIHCHLPSSFHPVRDGRKSINTEQRLGGLGSPGRSALVGFFVSSCVCIYTVSSVLLACAQPPCCALFECMNHHWNSCWQDRNHHSDSCHGQLGAGVSSNLSFGSSQEQWWDFSPCCAGSLHESCALLWSATLPK